MLTPTNSFALLGGSYVCADISENRSRNATVRRRTSGYTHAQNFNRPALIALTRYCIVYVY